MNKSLTHVTWLIPAIFRYAKFRICNKFFHRIQILNSDNFIITALNILNARYTDMYFPIFFLL